MYYRNALLSILLCTVRAMVKLCRLSHMPAIAPANVPKLPVVPVGMRCRKQYEANPTGPERLQYLLLPHCLENSVICTPS